MNINNIIPKSLLATMPIAYQFLKPVDLSKVYFSKKHTIVFKYQSKYSIITAEKKPISKIL